MLIKCSECGANISEYTENCPICGCPMCIIKDNYINKNECFYNGLKYNFAEAKQMIDNKENVKAMKSIANICNISLTEAKMIVDVIKFNNYEIPADYNECLERMRTSNRAEVERINASKVRCPYCKSSNVKKIGTGGRLLSTATLGLAGSKIGKQWHCNNCKSDF